MPHVPSPADSCVQPHYYNHMREEGGNCKEDEWGRQPFVRGGGTGWAVPGSAVGESKAQGDGKDGHRSELRRRPDAGPSAYALLRARNALRNPGFFHPSPLRLSEPLHSHLRPRVPAAHPLRFSPVATVAFSRREKKDTFPRLPPFRRIFHVNRCLFSLFLFSIMM